MTRSPRPWLLIALLASLAGCAGILFTPDPPRVTLADVRVAEVKLFEQKYRVALRIQNPNPFEVQAVGLDYELTVNGQPFCTGVWSKGVTVGPYATEVVEVEAFSDLTAILRQLRTLNKENLHKLPYRLRGHVRLGDGGRRLPFDHRGEFSFTGDAEPQPPKAPAQRL
jgi:LEA14-like dessication related protein